MPWLYVNSRDGRFGGAGSDGSLSSKLKIFDRFVGACFGGSAGRANGVEAGRGTSLRALDMAAKLGWACCVDT